MHKKLLKSKVLIYLIVCCIILSPVIHTQTATAASAADRTADLMSEIRTKYGFDVVRASDSRLESVLYYLEMFPTGLVKEMTDSYRNRKITPQIRFDSPGFT